LNSFETRKPKDPAVISEVDGVVRYGEVSKGLRKIYVESEDGKTTKEYLCRASIDQRASKRQNERR